MAMVGTVGRPPFAIETEHRGGALDARRSGGAGRAGLGVGSKLYLSIGGMFAITVVAAIVSFWAFEDLKRTMESFAGSAIPAITSSLQMAVDSAGAAAKAPEIVAARTEAQRVATEQEIAVLLSRLEHRVEGLAVLTDSQKRGDLSMIAALRDTIGILGAKMREKDGVATGVAEQVRDMLATHEAFIAKLSPLVSAENTRLTTRGSETIESVSRLIVSLLRGEIDVLQAGLRLNASLREILALLARAETAANFEEVAPLKQRFDAILTDMTAYERALPETEAAALLKSYSQALRNLGTGDEGMFGLRATELDYSQTRSFRQNLELKNKRQALGARRSELEGQFADNVEPVIHDATRNLAIGGERLTETVRDNVEGLVDRDVARLQTMLELAAEANLMAGLVNAGATAPDSATLDTLTSRYEAAKTNLDRAISRFQTHVESSEVAELARKIADFGAGDGNIFALRKAQLDIDDAAATALGDARAAAAAIDKEVQTIVANAERMAAASERSALNRISGSRNLLFAVVTFSALAGLLIGWLLVRRQVVARITRLAETMGVIADGDLETEVDTSGSDEITTMARTVEIFRDNGREVERLREEQRQAEARSAEERRAAMLSLADTFEQSVKAIVDKVGLSAQEMEKSSETMVSASDQVKTESTGVLTIAETTSNNVNTVAAAAEELAASVQEISSNISETSRVAQQAADKAQVTDQIVTSLDEDSQKIGEVVKLITDIAEQTNLLALNATIEAARAGDAGRGFAVVASEVKNLATQTAKATEEISAQIDAVQANTDQAVHAIREIGTLISDMSEKMVAVSSAIEQQSASTDEIARSSSNAAQSTNQVSSTMNGMMGVAGAAGTTADEVLSVAKGVAGLADSLEREVTGFLAKVRSGD